VKAGEQEGGGGRIVQRKLREGEEEGSVRVIADVYLHTCEHETEGQAVAACAKFLWPMLSWFRR